MYEAGGSYTGIFYTIIFSSRLREISINAMVSIKLDIALKISRD